MEKKKYSQHAASVLQIYILHKNASNKSTTLLYWLAGSKSSTRPPFTAYLLLSFDVAVPHRSIHLYLLFFWAPVNSMS
jgi:hypothetical protein